MIDAILGGRAVAPAVRAAAERALPHLFVDDPRRGAVRMRVVEAFLAEGVAESDLAGSTGYGYDDPARDRYESLLARVFRAERVLARLSIVSGTHAIVASLDALVPPGALLLAVNGAPYDTLRFALADAPHSLVARGVRYAEVPRTGEGDTDLEALATALRRDPPAVAFVQRSRGYASRRSLSIDGIGRIVAVVRASAPATIVFVDNCYGELVEEREPLEVGADVLAGSLIKNVGGGLAPTGGYVAGRADLIDRIAARIFAPGIGAGLGPTLGLGRTLMQGLFYAPLVVGETLRGLDFAAALFAELGYAVDPLPGERRTDIVQAIRLGSPARLIAFARGLQTALPVNARYAPEPGPVPGYVDPVIMSSGSFVSGSTIDLSCDAPLRAPWDVYLQGGVIAEHAALGAILAANALPLVVELVRELLVVLGLLTHEAVEECRRTVVGFDRDPRVLDANGGDGAADQPLQQFAGLHELGFAERVGFDVGVDVVRHSRSWERTARRKRAKALQVYVLEVMSGPLDGKTWSFDHEITIGRDDAVAGACITIDRYISRKHARLYEAEGGLLLADLASRNGTRIDGRPVASPETIAVGQRFTVGRTTLRVVTA